MNRADNVVVVGAKKTVVAFWYLHSTSLIPRNTFGGNHTPAHSYCLRAIAAKAGALRHREAETLAEWLKHHPGIKVLSRDRSASYKSGMNEGAPDAFQVADRFHLVQNLAEVLEQVLGSQGQAERWTWLNAEATATDGAATKVVLATPPSSLPKVQQLTQQRQDQRFKTHNKVWQLHPDSWSSGAIAQKVGVSSRTVSQPSRGFCPRQSAWTILDTRR